MRDRPGPGRRHKSNEIPALRALIKDIDITGLVITADALHTNRATAQAILDADGHYPLVSKDNQPTLQHAAARLLAPGTPAADHESAGTGIELADRGHGRRERRIVRTADATGLDFPAAAQVMRITRRRATGDDPSGGSNQTIYAITDLTPEQAGPAELGQIFRDHWAVEALHHIRDVTYTEDASRVLTRSTPRVMAALRNLAISQLKLLGWDNIADANRHLAAHRPDTLSLLGLTP
jgi:predicted transposase YbfD/YdcC